MKTLNTEFTYTGATKGPESLMGDGTLHSVQATLRSIVQKVMPNGSSKLTTLGSIGVSTTRDGTLSIDTGKFTKAVASDFGGIASLLAGMSDGSGIMSQISSGVDPYASSGGLLRTKIDDLTARNRRIDSQLSSMQLRLDKYQSNLEVKYSALEQTISGLQSQGNALSSMLG
jgi:flagellar hook-associated protein 2